MVSGLERAGGKSRRRSYRSQLPTPEGPNELTLRNRQRLRNVDMRLLRRMVQALLRETWPEGSFDLAICVVAAPEMTGLNETFLQHKGSTDVITFDYAEKVGPASRLSHSCKRVPRPKDKRHARPILLHGEIFVCVDEAVSQARRFHTTWQSELVRYVVHGVLHLLGYDDRNARARRRMKEAEDTVVRQLARQFPLAQMSPTEPEAQD
jgi:probable rRNA maturation factor